MLCSIIIPLYNKENFITTAIESVLSQSYRNFEIIVVDDGSTDDSVARVKTISDHRIKMIRQANNGVSSARNRGIELAKGELICFLDADDWYLPMYLETMVSMASRHPGIVFFASRFKSISNPQPADLCWDPGDTDRDELVSDFFYRWRLATFFYTSSVAIRRTGLSRLDSYFPIGEQWAEDQDVWFRLAEISDIAYCPAPLVGYRTEVEGSLCAIYSLFPFPPSHRRLEQRALDQRYPAHHRSAALRLVSEAKISLARYRLMEGQRYAAFIQLLSSWRGVVSRRWWVSLIMCVAVSPALVRRWESWRLQRKQTVVGEVF